MRVMAKGNFVVKTVRPVKHKNKTVKQFALHMEFEDERFEDQGSFVPLPL